MGIKDTIHSAYRKSPKFIHKTADYIIGNLPYSITLGKEYSNTMKLLKEEEYKSFEAHERYQFIELKRILTYSYNNVPYYHKIFDEVSFKPQNMNSIKEIEIIPFLTKDLIEKNFKDLLSTEINPERIGYNSTSGTSGHQLRFAFDKNTYYSREWAFIHNLWDRIGFKYGRSRMAAIRNETFQNGELYEYDAKNKRYVFNTYNMNSDNIKKTLGLIKSLKIEYIHTYPSAITILAKYILSNSIKMEFAIKAIIVTSEMLYPGQKEIIEEAFNTKVFTFYGHSERAALASWCECSDKYHVQTEYGYVELIDENGKTIHEPDVIGEIVCTGFNNLAMPLIRYKTADYSSICKNQECNCHRHYPLYNNIEGRRRQDALVGKNGNLITDTALNMHDMIYKNVDKFQFVQDEPGKCDLLIVKGENYKDKDEQEIIRAVNDKLAETIELRIKYVEDIQRTKAGKYRYIVRNFDI